MMNDIEKQIEGVNDEEDVNMDRLNSNNNDKKKIIMYVVGGFIALLLVGAIIYLVIINKDSDNNDNRNDKNNDVVEDNKDNKEDSAISYVACDGNTALLNVRNSVTGDIIDGLSCYQEVKIEEELEGNDAGEVGKISVDLGAGRLRKEDDIDKAVGIVLNKKNADKVKKGDILAFVYANNKQKGETAVEEMQDAYTIVEEPVKKEKYILGII